MFERILNLYGRCILSMNGNAILTGLNGAEGMTDECQSDVSPYIARYAFHYRPWRRIGNTIAVDYRLHCRGISEIPVVEQRYSKIRYNTRADLIGVLPGTYIYMGGQHHTNS
jgi:hypothetical protein